MENTQICTQCECEFIAKENEVICYECQCTCDLCGETVSTEHLYLVNAEKQICTYCIDFIKTIKN